MKTLLGARTLLGAPGIATRNEKLPGAPGLATSKGRYERSFFLQAFPCREDLRHLHWMHLVRPCLPHRCAGDGASHSERGQAGRIISSGGGLRRLQAL